MVNTKHHIDLIKKASYKYRWTLINGKYTLWLFTIAMENGPFIDDFPTNTSIYKGFSMAMLNNQMVYIYIYSICGPGA